MKQQLSTTRLVLILICSIILLAAGCVSCPMYRVWNAKMTGEAELQRAQKNRQIQVAQSMAKMEAARYEAQGDTIRAWGISRSNQIIGASLTEAYLRWLFIDKLGENKNSVIYLPTEAGIPILEANRLKDAH